MRPYHNPSVSIEQRWERFWAVYHQDGWEPETKALVREVLKPGDIFVDIGAWIGPVSLWARECLAEVIAIEPDPVAIPELKRRLPDAEIWEGAVGLTEGTLKLASHHGFGDSMSLVSAKGRGITVPCWPLPHVIGDRRPKLAVMDIEGYEMTLLPTVAPYLAALGCTLQVALHHALPEPEWFKDFSVVHIPKTPRRGGETGRSLAVVARP